MSTLREHDRGHAVVGVTGHRSLRRDEVIDQRIRAALASIFEELGRPKDITLLSMLAEGADTMVAEQALSLGWSLTALLPMPLERYRRTFSTDASHELARLLAAAERTVELIPVCSSPECYLEAGRRMVAQCDVLLAVWDGGPGSGIGGTADVVGVARETGVPVKVVEVRAGGHRAHSPRSVWHPRRSGQM